MSKGNYFFITISLILSVFNNVYAECKFSPESTVQTPIILTIPLKMQNMTLGPAIGSGNGFYTDEQAPVAGPVIVDCTEGTPNVLYQRLITPFPLSDYDEDSYVYAGKQYDTGHPGTAVAISAYLDYAFPAEQPIDNCGTLSTKCVIENPEIFEFGLKLFTTGPVPSGIINGSDLPCLEQSIGTVDSQVTVVRACFTGSMIITAETCNVMQPDITVDMGSHDITDNLDSISAMPWVKFRIQLANCPQFHGNYYGKYLHFDEPIYGGNQISYNLMPLTAIVDANNGIFAIDDTLGDSARGVGIQIGYSAMDNEGLIYWPARLVETNSPYPDQQALLRIDLAAKYVLIGPLDEVRPGKANAKVVFTINYF